LMGLADGAYPADDPARGPSPVPPAAPAAANN